MKKLVAVGSLMLLVVIVAQFLGSGSEPVAKNEQLEQKSRPFDHFHFQRSYPDEHMDHRAYNAELDRIKAETAHLKDSRAATAGSWTLEGPTNIGGRINTIAVDPLNNDIIYVGAAAGGIFKTTDGGDNWLPIADDLAYLAISDITIDPNLNTTIYAGTGDLNITGTPHIGNGVYKSIDGGNSWTHKGLADECIISRIIVDPSDSQVVYAAAMGKPFIRNNARGLYKSTDGGDIWAQILFLSVETGVIDMVMDPFNSNVLYCSGWDRIRTNEESLITGDGARIWKTADGGSNWTQLTGGLPQIELSRIGLAISQQTPDLVFATVVDTTFEIESIYRSTDAGTTWSPLVTVGLDPNALGGFGWYFGQVRVSPFDDDELSILGVELHSSFDGGTFWSQTVPDWWMYEVHADCHDMLYLDANSILLATDGGLYRTDNGMGDWVDIEDLPNTQFYRIAIDPHQPGVYAGGAQDNGTSSGNAANINNWPREYGGDGFSTIYHPFDEDLRYYETQNGGLIYDDGFAQNFTTGIDSEDRTNWDSPFIMSSADPDVMYTGTYRVYRNSNAPYGSWSPISNDLTDGVIFSDMFHTISAIAEAPTNAAQLYAGTTDGNVWRTLDGGNNWTNVTGNLPDRYVTTVKGSPDSDNVVYVTHSGYKYNDFIPHVHRSTDNGTNWTDISGNLPQMSVNDIHVYPNSMDSVLFVATDAGVYATTDGGNNWGRVGNDMPLIPVFDIDLDLINDKLIAGTFARSIQSFPIDSIVSDLITSAPANSTKDVVLNVYPNPCSDRLNIDFPIGFISADLLVMDIKGKVVTRQSDLRLSSSVSVSDLSDGIYIAKLSDKNGGIRISRFLKTD